MDDVEARRIQEHERKRIAQMILDVWVPGVLQADGNESVRKLSAYAADVLRQLANAVKENLSHG